MRFSAWLAVGVLIALSPWLTRGVLVHGRFVFIKDSLPYVFWQGNTFGSQGTDKLLVDASAGSDVLSASWVQGWNKAEVVRSKAVSINDASLSKADLAELAKLPDEIQRMDWFGRRISTELARDPWQYPKMCVVRLQQWFWFDATNPKSFLWPYRAVYFLLLLGVAFGLNSWLRTPAWRPILIAAVVLTLVHVGIITSARFRVMFEFTMAPAAAVGLGRMLHAILGRFGFVRVALEPIDRFPIIKSTSSQ